MSKIKTLYRSLDRIKRGRLLELTGFDAGFMSRLLTGERGFTAATALKLDDATERMAAETKGEVPHIKAHDVCDVCAGCKYSKKARGEL